MNCFQASPVSTQTNNVTIEGWINWNGGGGAVQTLIYNGHTGTQGYGIKTEAPDLAMAVWPQFVRARMEIGPSELSLRDVHARLLEEHGWVPNIQPMPATLRIANVTLHIHDFWNRTDELKASGDGQGSLGHAL